MKRNSFFKTAIACTCTTLIMTWTPASAPAPAHARIVYGVNGHDGWSTAYPIGQADARFQLLAARNLRSYRVDISTGQTAVMDTLVALSKKYSITLRPMLYPASQADAYTFVRRYANDVKIWEIGNEQALAGKEGAQQRIDALVTTYRGVMQASTELKANLKTTINVTNCNDDYELSRCYGDPQGDMWFLDMARASGFRFDYVSYHYYPLLGDKGYWFDKYMSQARAMATKFNTKIFLNEINCGEIYRGNTTGGYAGDAGCYDSLNQFLYEVKSKYADIVAEVNAYEMLDEPNVATMPGVPASEAHFGLMYDINRPKPLLNLLTQYARGT